MNTRELVDALREAASVLRKTTKMKECFGPSCSFCASGEEHLPSLEADLAQEALSKINPILNELEE